MLTETATNDSMDSASKKKAALTTSAKAAMGGENSEKLSIKLNGQTLHTGDGRPAFDQAIDASKASGKLTVVEGGKTITVPADSQDAKYYTAKTRFIVVSGMSEADAAKKAAQTHGLPGNEQSQTAAKKRAAATRQQAIDQNRNQMNGQAQKAKTAGIQANGGGRPNAAPNAGGNGGGRPDGANKRAPAGAVR